MDRGLPDGVDSLIFRTILAEQPRWNQRNYGGSKDDQVEFAGLLALVAHGIPDVAVFSYRRRLALKATSPITTASSPPNSTPQIDPPTHA